MLRCIGKSWLNSEKCWLSVFCTKLCRIVSRLSRSTSNETAFQLGSCIFLLIERNNIFLHTNQLLIVLSVLKKTTLPMNPENIFAAMQ